MSIITLLVVLSSFITSAFQLETLDAVGNDDKTQLIYLAKKLTDITDAFTAVKNELAYMTQRLEKLEGISGCDKSKERRLIQGFTNLPAVAFSAHLSQDINLGDSQTLEYDVVLTNTGNHYNPLHGIFTAPVSGIYLFSATLLTKPEHAVHLAMERNGIDVAYLYSHNNGWDQASQTVIVHLSKGDEVWMRHQPKADIIGHVTLIAGYSTFSGVLLNITE